MQTEQEMVDEILDDETAAAIAEDFTSSIHYDGMLPDWRKEDTWGDPEEEYVPEEYQPAATEKAGTSSGAMRSWITRKRSITDRLRSAVNNRDAKSVARAQNQMRSGENIYKAIADIESHVKKTQETTVKEA